MKDQPSLPWTSETVDIIGYGLLAAGFILVLTSTWALGWMNTFLGKFTDVFSS